MLQRYYQGNFRMLLSILGCTFRHKMRQGITVCGGCVLLSVSSVAYSSQTSPVVRQPIKSNKPAPFTQIIDKIYINVGDVFDTDDPKENNFLFRFANKIHINTRDSVILDILLFKPGDVLSMQILAESERLLRSQEFLYDAVIRPINIRPNKVDIQVFAKDVWTLAGGASFSREGGENSSSFEIEESNFLGYGKRLKIRKKEGVEREEHSYQYHDPQLFHSRHELTVAISDNSDGQRSEINFLRPFYAIEAKKSYGVSWLRDDRIETTPKVAAKIRHRVDFWESFVGISDRLGRDRTLRYTYGYTYDQHRYGAIDPINDPLAPENVRDSYPWVGLAYVEDRFIKTKRINFLNKTEDINLGHDMNLRLGWTDQNIGALQDGIVLIGGYRYNAIIHQGALLSHSFSFDGRIIKDRWVNALISSETRYFFKKDSDRTNYISLNLDYGRELTDEKKLVLGGDTGLRGYPLDLQRGDNRFLLTWEKRFYTDWHLLRLLYVGGVVFFDIGRVWSTGATYSDNQGILKDIGFGLRGALSKAGKNLVLHLDFALPLDGNGDIKDHQIIAKSASRF